MTPRRLEILLSLYSGTFTTRTYNYSSELTEDIKYLESVGLLIPDRYTVNTARVEEFLKFIELASDSYIEARMYST